MNDQQRHLLISLKGPLGDDLDPKDIFSYLLSKFVLNSDEVEIIKAEVTRRDRTEKLLRILREKDGSAFVHFHDALEKTSPHLADLLKSGLSDEDAYNDAENGSLLAPTATILRDGSVPKRPAVYTARPKEVEKLRTALYTLREDDGWVLLHGMAGSGKTILATDAIDDEELLASCFPGGVFWVTVGLMDASRLLMKMQNLCSWVDSEQRFTIPPRNVEEARDRLRTLFAHQHPRSLLILDGVWHKEDARHFDIRVRTLATSRSSFVTETISGHVAQVHIEEGFSNEQSKDVLSQWMNRSTASLPVEANELIKECKGLPLAISMIGALLKDRPNRWGHYLKQMKEGKVSKVRSKLPYDYQTLHDAISISVTELEDDVRKKYENFAIFEEDSRIPASVLGLLWDEEVIDVEDIMDGLVSRSLAKRYNPSNDLPFDTYGIHDLQLDYLKETLKATPGGSALKDMHKTLVEKYEAKVNGNFAMVENDGYIYWTIINHLIQAKMVEKAVELLLSFHWIDAKLKATGAPDLISDYYKVMGLVDKDVKDQLQDFVHFISINSYLLSTPGRQDYGLIQLALAQPFATGVHKTAKEVMKSSPGKDQFFVGWCNKPDDSSQKCLLNVRPHNGPVYCCDWSRDNSNRIVSCGGDLNVKIWNACNGETMFTLSGHTDTIHCCQFSPDSKKIASASADSTVKVWDSDTGSILLTFKGHCGDVNCCTFCPTDNDLIATCSSDKTIKLWNVSGKNLVHTLSGHKDIVNWCCFSPDGKRIASASNDCTLKIWNVEDGSFTDICANYMDFISYCVYNPSGEQIMATSQSHLQLIDTKTRKQIKSIPTMLSVLSIAFSPDGKYAVGTHADATAQLWNVDGSSCVGVFRGHSGWLHSVSYSPDGQKIVTASEDELCKVWKVEPVEKLISKLRKLFDASFDRDGGPVIVVANSNHEIQVIDGSNGNYLRKTSCLGSKITACRLSVDGNMIIAGLESGLVKIIDAESCMEIRSLEGHSGGINDFIVASNGVTLVTASEDHAIKIWDLKSQKEGIECTGHVEKVVKCALFHKTMRFLSASFDGTAKVWDISDGRCVFTCVHSDSSLLSCAVSSDDQMIASTSADTTAKLWSASSGELLHVLRGHADCVRCCTFSPDCSLLVTGSDESTVKIWDCKTGENKATCEGHKVWVTDIHFSPDGKRFVSVSNNIKWWKRDGTLLQTFLVRGNYLKQILTSRSFERFITIDDTGQLYILDEMKN